MGRNKVHRSSAIDLPQEAADSRAATKMLIALFKLPRIDPKDEEAFAERIDVYLSMCLEHNVRPGIEGACLSLGYTQTSISDTARGALFNELHVTARVVRQLLLAILEGQILSGDLSPSMGMFLLKNHLGYRESGPEAAPIMIEMKDGSALQRIAEKYMGSLPDPTIAERDKSADFSRPSGVVDVDFVSTF